jgi:uncharacterized membrane protein YkoI
MFSKKIVTGMSIFIFALLTTAAYAHSRNNDAAAFFFLKGAAISVRQVIENVQKEENGQVISFKIEKKEDSPLQYEMKIFKDNKIFEAKVDPKTGKVLKTESKGVFSHFFEDQKKQPIQAKLSLKDAISIVEKQYDGKVLGGTLQRRSDVAMFRIEAANNDGIFTVMVDAENGELFRISNIKYGRHHNGNEED